MPYSPFPSGLQYQYRTRLSHPPVPGKFHKRKAHQPCVRSKAHCFQAILAASIAALELWASNPAATTLYEEMFCGSHDNSSVTYYERSVNATTGALGPDVSVYSWSNGNLGYEYVQFVANHMFDFAVPGYRSWD